MQFSDIFERQQRYFNSGETRDRASRERNLKRLLEMIDRHQDDICDAMASDFGKPREEAWLAEILTSKKEIEFHLRNLKKWVKPVSQRGSLLNFPSANAILHEPFGVTLIIGAWNYPFYLLIMPLIGAISAGNTAILKPSELAPTVSSCLSELFSRYFPQELVFVAEGGVEVNQQLLALPFNKIFFTGSTRVGKLVMKAASEHLTPVTLELGGKSPAIVHSDASLRLAVKRIWWGKCLNAGQTCVAPDYVLVHEKHRDAFVGLSKEVLEMMYPDGFQPGKNWTRMVNEHHFNRVLQLTKDATLLLGGQHDVATRIIHPALISEVGFDHPSMQEEIFGPVLPMLTYSSEEELMEMLKKAGSPLALYLFTNDKRLQKRVFSEIPFGGGCVNDTLSHLVNANLPFGGVGSSGMGNYHGFNSFRTFSHQKAKLVKTLWPDFAFRYPPYGKAVTWLRKLF